MLKTNTMNERVSPLTIKIGFGKLFDSYKKQLDSNIPLVAEKAKAVLDLEEKYPELAEGLETQEAIARHKAPIRFILDDLFSDLLTQNEIKIATAPFQEKILRASKRYQDIKSVVGEDFKMELTDFNDDEYYIMACSIILNSYYNYSVDFKRPFYYKIPDRNGIVRSYRVLYNADFVSITKGETAKEITEADIAELLDNFENIEVWKEKFPPNSWVFNGFVIANMYDATIDVSLSSFKEGLLEMDTKEDRFIFSFQEIIRSIFNLPELNIGYAVYDSEDKTFSKLSKNHNVNSFILHEDALKDCKLSLCSLSYHVLCEKKEVYTLSNVPKQLEEHPENVLLQSFDDQNIGSAIIAPLVHGEALLGVLEIVSNNVGRLNSINANKLKDIMPYLVDSMKRAKERWENQMELLIQNECTSIHPSVHWRFRNEARRVMKQQDAGNMASFREVVFEDVYPLFGQMDIKGSSELRNDATKRDLELQLRMVHRIMTRIKERESLPIYEKYMHTIEAFSEEIKDILEVDSERKVLNFLQDEIIPLFQHVEKKDDDLKDLIQDYSKRIDSSKGFIYKYRKEYDESVMLVNKTLASLLDRKQEEAQTMYSHYYERFKTDGVEHNMYIGESITKERSFNPIYLYNLRLWQLQVMCEMENRFYKLKKDLPLPMEVASMILVFNSSLSLRFRMDEKRFDVDGTYNARYEVVKKRVDKAHIKGTEERITQPGKITVVYSQEEDEEEYLGYIRFLQSKDYIGNQVEILELEDLQGVTGLKAIRVNVLYKNEAENQKLYTYNDLMEEIQR
tara:strand:- start:36484 stop:38865 length:2382 start_codon:yes stop_codon:yes gene_type:complete